MAAAKASAPALACVRVARAAARVPEGFSQASPTSLQGDARVTSAPSPFKLKARRRLTAGDCPTRIHWHGSPSLIMMMESLSGHSDRYLQSCPSYGRCNQKLEQCVLASSRGGR